VLAEISALHASLAFCARQFSDKCLKKRYQPAVIGFLQGRIRRQTCPFKRLNLPDSVAALGVIVAPDRSSACNTLKSQSNNFEPDWDCRHAR
jgi:hypothetical protein